jgi:HEAT repeat protein
MVKDKRGTVRIVRWVLSVVLVVLGLTTTWAWGRVARLAEPTSGPDGSRSSALYAIWQPTGTARAVLFRSTDRGMSWQPLALPSDRGVVPATWADDGGLRLAVVLDDGTVLRSDDQGDRWSVVSQDLPVLSLAWGTDGSLYLGTDGQGIYRAPAAGTRLDAMSMPDNLFSAPVTHLAMAGGRLFAATRTVLFYSDDSGNSWTQASPVTEGISALAAIDQDRVYIGTEIAGVYLTTDAGQTWQPESNGLGLAAGQMVKVTALRVDPEAPGVLYAAVDDILGSTEAHASAAGTFATMDGGASWLPLVGPAFPEAQHASSLVLVPGKPLYAQAVTVGGLQAYAPDLEEARAALTSADPVARATAVRMLGLAKVREAEPALLAALGDSDPAVSLAASEALGTMDDPAVASKLLVAVDHPDAQVRANAARALGMLRVEAAVGSLRAMLLGGGDSEMTVAAQALGQIGSPAAVDALLAALADAEPTARWHAALAAVESVGEPAVGPLVKMMDSQEPALRRNAAEALGWIGSPTATQALVRVLQRDGEATVRFQAAWALGEIGDPAARAALEKAWNDDPIASVQSQAGMSLVALKDQPVVATGWPATWAPALNQLQPLRWTILGLSLLSALWLALGRKQMLPTLAFRRITRGQ